MYIEDYLLDFFSSTEHKTLICVLPKLAESVFIICMCMVSGLTTLQWTANKGSSLGWSNSLSHSNHQLSRVLCLGVGHCENLPSTITCPLLLPLSPCLCSCFRRRQFQNRFLSILALKIFMPSSMMFHGSQTQKL